MKRFCGFATGFVFFISGLLKLLDPTGAGLVMKEYYDWMHLDFLAPTATAAGVFFALAEAVTGAGLITGVWRKVIAPIAVGLQGAFTLLTLFLVIFNPEMDCGCFGEAIHLTHGQTFIKNIILLCLLLIYYIPARYLGETKKKKYASFAVVCASVAAFTLYSLLFIPMADFTDLRPGTYINKTTEVTGTAYEAVFVYEKDGKEEVFSLENLPDTTWTFVRSETTALEQNDARSATISISDMNGEYADSLLSRGKVMAVSIYRDNLSDKDIRKIEKFMANASDSGFTPVILAATKTDFNSMHSYLCDYKTLITLNRSNGGATYINDGYIIRKWAKRALPDREELATLSDEDPTDTFIGRDTKTSLAFQGFLLYVFAVMLLL